MPVSIDRRAPADTLSHPRRPPAFCRPNLPHFCAVYGRLHLVFKPAGLPLQRRRHRRPPPGQAPRLGRRHQSIRTQEAGGHRGKLRSRGSRTPEREGRTPTERGVSRGPSPWTRSLGTFSGARESTSPAGARTGNPKCLPEPSGKSNSPFRAKTETACRGGTRQIMVPAGAPRQKERGNGGLRPQAYPISILCPTGAE